MPARQINEYRATSRNADRGLAAKALKAERKKTGESRREQDRRRYFQKFPLLAGIKTGPMPPETRFLTPYELVKR